VLIPLLFMGDVVGRLFREFAVTLAATIIVSAVVSLTLVPSLCGLWLKKPPHPKPGGFEDRAERAFNWLIDRYDVALQWVLKRQTATLIVAVVTFLITVLLYIVIPKGLFPTQDTGEIQGVVEAAQTVSFGKMAELQREVAEQLMQDPDVVNVSSFVGVDAQNTTVNTSRVLIELKPLDQRHEHASDVIRRLQTKVRVPGVALFMQPVQDLTIDASVSRTQYQFVLEGADPNAVQAWAKTLVGKLSSLKEITDVSTDVQDQGLAAFVDVDRDAAGRLGVSLATVDNILYDAFGQRIVSTIFTQSNQYRVILENSPSFNGGPEAFDKLYLPTASGGQTPLSSVAKIRIAPAPLVVNHLGQFPASTISFNLAKGVSLGEAVKSIEAAEASAGVPPTITTTFLGAAETFQKSLTNELWLILAAIVVIYIVLGVLYESFIHPITILSTLPSATIGALLGLMLFGQDLGVVGIIGLILLFGIVKKNAIMMIDFALDAERNEGLDPQAAIHQAALLRFRPILMTTMAALLGAVPLLIGGGYGAELRQPLGIAIVGGLILSQLLTLFTTPVIYLWFDRLARDLARRAQGRAGEAGAPAE
jgi:multidrug efflux pump